MAGHRERNVWRRKNAFSALIALRVFLPTQLQIPVEIQINTNINVRYRGNPEQLCR